MSIGAPFKGTEFFIITSFIIATIVLDQLCRLYVDVISYSCFSSITTPSAAYNILCFR